MVIIDRLVPGHMRYALQQPDERGVRGGQFVDFLAGLGFALLPAVHHDHVNAPTMKRRRDGHDVEEVLLDQLVDGQPDDCRGHERDDKVERAAAVPRRPVPAHPAASAQSGANTAPPRPGSPPLNDHLERVDRVLALRPRPGRELRSDDQVPG